MLYFNRLNFFRQVVESARNVLFVWLILITFSADLLANDARTGSRKMPSSGFWTDVYPVGTIFYTGCPDESLSNRTRFFYHLYRQQDGDWYLMGNGNGQLWKLDSSLYWNRLDKTFFFGYDFQSYMLYPGMKYGGYGFWKTNGMLFNYREKIGEWELVPLSDEYPNLGEYCFYDVRRNVLMQCGAFFLDDTKKNSKVVIDSLFELDMISRDWKSIGKLNLQASYFLNPSGMLPALETPRGRCLFTMEADTCAMVDYLSQKCIIPNRSIRNRFKGFIQQSNNGNLLVSTRYNLLLVDTATFTIKDSLMWSDMAKNPEAIVPILEPQRADPFVGQYLIFFLVGTIVVAGGWYVYKRRDKLKTPGDRGVSLAKTNIPFNGFTISERDGFLQFNGHALENLLEEQEVKLLRILMEKKKAGETLNTLQFNELLGIDSRSPDNQKKIRSEVVKGVNSGLQQLGFPHEAVCRLRHAEDRRMMMYFLHDSISI